MNGGGALSVTRSIPFERLHQIWYAYIKHQNTGQVRFGLQPTDF